MTSPFAARVALARTIRHPLPRSAVHGATSWLLALADDPMTAAGAVLTSARLAVADALDVVTQPALLEAFELGADQLELIERMLRETALPDLAAVTRRATPFPLEPAAPLHPPATPEPAREDTEAVHGLRTTLRATLDALTTGARRLGQAPRRGGPAQAVLPVLAEAALAARWLEHVADVVVAHAWVLAQPGTPALPGHGGALELTAGPRARPVLRWAQQGRLRFTPGSVQVVTASGRFSVGEHAPIGALLWVAPPPRGAASLFHDPSEAWAGSPEHDHLGTVHVLDLQGRSMLAVAVADWAPQPTTTVDQVLVDSTTPDAPLAVARGVLALDALGFGQAAATLGVPLRRGVAHPAAADGAVGLRGVGPDRQPYRGAAATRRAASARHVRRRRWWDDDLGPGTRWSRWIHPLVPAFTVLGPLALLPGGGHHPVQLVIAALTLAVVLEPWAAWSVALLRDLAPRPHAAPEYRGPQGRRLVLAERELVVRSTSGHETWLGGPHDVDLGITRIVRLLHRSGAWGYALATADGRWRAVLPAHAWVPADRVGALERFAREAGLELADQDVEPLPRLADEVVSPTTPHAAERTSGPRPRALLLQGLVATPTALLCLLGSERPLLLAGLVLVISYGGAAAVTLLQRRHRRGA